MKKTIISICMLLVGSMGLYAQSGLNRKEFTRHWTIESESPNYQLIFLNDTVEITAPKGFTLWRKEKMKGDVIIEYDACVMEQRKGDRLSDLNCFWMATDPNEKDIWKRLKWRSGNFDRCYSLQLYYLGYGGNHNSTTRFRRYDGDYKAFVREKKRPQILTEYTDPDHLLQKDKWYHIRIANSGNRVTYTINDEQIVDFRDPHPLTEGWFGFRTTVARVQITNFRVTNSGSQTEIPLQWIGDTPEQSVPNTFGVPFARGTVKKDDIFTVKTDSETSLPTENWPLAYWPDGSVKWGAFSTIVPANTNELKLTPMSGNQKKSQKSEQQGIRVIENDQQFIVHTGKLSAYLPKQGTQLFDSLLLKKTRIVGGARLICQANEGYQSLIRKVSVERSGKLRTLVKVEGMHQSVNREWLPYIVRLYFYANSEQVKLMHTLLFDGDAEKDFIRSIGVQFDVPLRESLYNRHIAFAGDGDGVWSEPVQPLTGRRVLTLNGDKTLYQQQMEGKRIPEKEAFDLYNQNLIQHWAAWDGYRLSQLSPRAFSIRKRTHDDRPWIGTIEGNQSRGYAFVGDVSGGLGVCLEDFWQSYPSTLEINGARSSQAQLTVWLWSPEAEPMDLRHYDHVAHDLNASYEDVQEGLSTPYGIARTSVMQLCAESGYPGKEGINQRATALSATPQLMATPEYLHRQRAFGVWSLPNQVNKRYASLEERLDANIDYYQKMIRQHGWYGYWNYGDLMHAYDPIRHEWRYDIGGFAWDNTELASNSWLWYSFLRSGRQDIWQMAKAISRHTTEVDVYHFGPNAGLGSRHNVSHWGCGAKEARISQAVWNRFLYYLTADERSGDLMTEVKDAEQKLYTLDPMRLAEPRSKYPCTAPARLRIGPDWMAYVGNWMTEWERTGNTLYRDKILAGMKSIANLPNGLFTGNKALGFDPATGILSYEGDPQLQNTNHLMTIMGGFELMNELMEMIDLPQWNAAWLDHATRYTPMSRSNFYIPRLTAYAAYLTGDKALRLQAWKELTENGGKKQKTFSQQIKTPLVLEAIDESTSISTNGVATWGLDAIYLMEVLP